MSDLDYLNSQQLSSATGKDRIATLLDIAEHLSGHNPQEMRPYLDEAIQLGTAFEDAHALAQSYALLGLYHRITGELNDALRAYESALEFYNELDDKRGAAEVYSQFGVIFDNKGDYEQALNYQLMALSSWEDADDENGLLSSHTNLGSLYLKIEDFENALDAYLKAQALAEKHERMDNLSLIYSDIGSVYSHLGELEKSLDYRHKSIEVARKSGNKMTLARDLVHLGETCYRLERYEEALEAYMQALELAEETGYRDLLPSIYLNLGLVQTVMHDYEMAGEHLETGLEIAKNNSDEWTEMASYKALAELCEAEHNFEEALAYFKQYSQLKDDVLSEAKRQELDRLQAQFDADKQSRDAEIYRLRNIELAEMNRTLERIDNEKNNFLKVVAHDLQGPLSSIQMNADMIRNYFETLPPDKIRQRLDAMIDTANAMTQTVTQILDLRLLKSGKGQFDLNSINPVPLALQVVEAYREKAREKDIQIHQFLDGHVTEVLADEVALRRVLDNLVSNAVKYTEPGNNIFVSIDDEEQVSIIIRDEGLGMTEEDLEMVFNEFITLSARPTGRERSTGLGLAIVKMLVEGMNGTIRAESQGKGKGSTFTVILPHPRKS
ncbi:MAG: tetratricopeptide repeat-containing sensor histidine kinase [Chloroflexi bacterium]|nr:tetratricopeptide repeat-containing sensor histidine kinase [Chloroflexota bacterium]